MQHPRRTTLGRKRIANEGEERGGQSLGLEGGPEKSPMHLLLVKFHSGLSHDDVVQNLEERLPLFRAVPGLIQKYYAREAATGDRGKEEGRIKN